MEIKVDLDWWAKTSEQKKPAVLIEAAGRVSYKERCLEGKFASKQEFTGRAIGNRGIAKPCQRTAEPSIFKERIDAEEVGMVENVQRRCMELKGNVLTEFNGFEGGEVADAANGVLLNVAAYITKRSAENGLRGAAVQNVTNLIVVNRNRCTVHAVDVQRVYADQGIGESGAANGFIPGNAEKDAGV